MNNDAGQAMLPQKSGNIVEFGVRLREERERLGLNQTEMGEAGGVNRSSQSLYERGVSACSIDYLFMARRIGADLEYLFTGIRGGADLSEREGELLAAFRLLGDGDQEAVIRVTNGLAGLAMPSRQVHSPRRKFRGET
ncbi:MAG: helix-turn-helix transcriptional regulator [Sphingomonas sp.]|nr:helix-turn-helix transcriptional regulator [Sphingomonas sp.]